MEAKLNKISKEHAVIRWQDGGQFGEIDIKWNSEMGKLIVDTEMLGIETMIKIIKSIKLWKR